MTDQELGASIVEATTRLKRAVAEREVHERSLAEKVHALHNASQLAERLQYDASRGIVVGESRHTVAPWPTHDEMRLALKLAAEARADVAQLRKTVQQMTGLDKNDLGD